MSVNIHIKRLDSGFTLHHDYTYVSHEEAFTDVESLLEKVAFLCTSKVGLKIKIEESK